MVLSTALFDRAPFRTCLCHGVVLDENKQKLSKRLKNYPDPIEAFDTYGADALRYYLVSSPLLAGGDLAMPQDGRGIAQALRQAIIPVWNAYYFLTLYANIDGYTARVRSDQQNLLDRYILGKTRGLIEVLQERLDANDLPGAYAALPVYIDALNNWYIRRSRSRFWREAKDEDKRDAFDTLYTVLTVFVRAVAPLLPFVTEQIYRNLTGEASVHLADWPDAESLPAERDLVRRMDQVRELCAAVMSLREAKNLRTRLPLRSLTVAHPDVDALAPYRDVIAEEVNVKEVRFTADPSTLGEQQLVVSKTVGKRIGKDIRTVMAAAAKGDWSARPDGSFTVGGIDIGAEEAAVRMLTSDGLDSAPFDRRAGLVLLDTQLYDDLEREGLARDFVRLVQQTRKEAGFEVTDRIRVVAQVPERIASAIRDHRGHICHETLAVDLKLNEDVSDGYQMTYKLSQSDVTIEVARA
jgi:isoleucyl-tRNA synthetase